MSATLLLMAAMAARPATFETVKFDVKAGETLVYTTTATSDTDSEMGAFSTKIKSRTSLEITGSKDGWLEAKATLTEHSLDTDGPMGDMVGDPKGMVTTFLVSPRRQLKDWKLTGTGNLSPDQAEGFKASGASEAKAGLDGLTLPEGDLTEGATWEMEREPASGMFAGMKTTTKGTIKTIYKALSFTGSGADRTLEIEAKSAGSYSIDVDSPMGALTIDVKEQTTTTFTVRVRDGVATKIVTDSTSDMSAQFGEFTTKTKSTTELVKA